MWVDNGDELGGSSDWHYQAAECDGVIFWATTMDWWALGACQFLH